MKFIQSIADKVIVFTGKHPDYTHAELAQMAVRLGARVGAALSKKTDVLVLCRPNERWKHSSYGLKEARVMEYQQKGLSIVMIDGDSFLSLRSSIPAGTIEPVSHRL
ncbi:BRCT domain-containing protein [Sanguibacter antarcticus]|uniref:BRCT domain-containing protein n=1 Tax=Sanguibacter antarcticus TaxID=372484 RepID=UPI0011798C4F|nr:BRCT domain-containing protein [Sanguibacter antarcticus]